MLDKSILGRKIKSLRQQMGYSQTEFGKKIGISKQALSSIERGVYWPGIDTLENIAVLCRVTLNSFSDISSDVYKVAERCAPYADFTERENRLIHRFRLLREDQKKAVEIILYIHEV